MKRYVYTAVLIVTALCAVSPLFGYKLKSREQLYLLYTQRQYSYAENISEGIYYLELALRADFANPLNALSVIKTTAEWEHYRNAFTMHIYLKLVELYLQMGSKYDKREALFYNYPWKRENLESLEIAERWYRYALVYWKDAEEWAGKIRPFRFNLEPVQYWEDEAHRIRTGDLDYEEIIGEHLARLAQVKKTFEDMLPGTY